MFYDSIKWAILDSQFITTIMESAPRYIRGKPNTMLMFRSSHIELGIDSGK